MDIFLCACGKKLQCFSMHASEATLERRRTSLGAGAAERSDGAHEDNDGHESSHGNADDHRHWERFCIEQQQHKTNMFFYNDLTTTVYMHFSVFNEFNVWHVTVEDNIQLERKSHLSFSNTHTSTLSSPPVVLFKSDFLLPRHYSLGTKPDNLNKYSGTGKEKKNPLCRNNNSNKN